MKTIPIELPSTAGLHLLKTLEGLDSTSLYLVIADAGSSHCELEIWVDSSPSAHVVRLSSDGRWVIRSHLEV